MFHDPFQNKTTKWDTAEKIDEHWKNTSAEVMWIIDRARLVLKNQFCLPQALIAELTFFSDFYLDLVFM